MVHQNIRNNPNRSKCARPKYKKQSKPFQTRKPKYKKRSKCANPPNIYVCFSDVVLGRELHPHVKALSSMFGLCLVFWGFLFYSNFCFKSSSSPSSSSDYHTSLPLPIPSPLSCAALPPLLPHRPLPYSRNSTSAGMV